MVVKIIEINNNYKKLRCSLPRRTLQIPVIGKKFGEKFTEMAKYFFLSSSTVVLCIFCVMQGSSINIFEGPHYESGNFSRAIKI